MPRLQLPKSSRPSEPACAELGIKFVLSLAIIALVIAAFFPSFQNDFVTWDDPDNVTTNPYLSPLNAENLWWMCTGFRVGHYHPLTWLSLALDKAVWGHNPAGYHATNVCIHAVNAVLLMFLTHRLIRIARAGTTGQSAREWVCAALAGALWGVHPLRVESVAWVTERRDVLSTVFLLGATLAYLRAVEPGAPGIRSRSAYVACIALAVLSCLSKAWGMSFFVLLLALDFYPLRRLPSNPAKWLSRPAIRVVVEKVPLIALGVATAVLAGLAQHTDLATKTLAQWSAENRLVQALYGLRFYLEKSVWPDNLSPLYELPIRIDPLETRYLVAYAVVLAGALAVFLCWRRIPAVVAAAGVYAVSLLPVLGILQSGEQFVADRYSYIATMPLFILMGAGVLVLMGRTAARTAKLLAAGAGVVLVTLGLLTFAQTSKWHNTETLWAYASTVTPTSQVLNKYAMELERQGRKDDALAMYKIAVRQNPTDGRAWFTYANVMKDSGRLDEAILAFQQTAKYLPQAYMGYQNLGVVYETLGRHQEALAAFKLAVDDVEKGGRRKLSGGPYMTYGLALLQQGDAPGAEQAFRKALKFQDTRDDAAARLKSMGK